MVASLVIVISVMLLLSAFFSGMEIAYLSSNRLRIEIESENRSITQRLIEFFMTRPGMYITTILVGNNVVMVIYGSEMSELMQHLLGVWNLSDGLEAFVTTLISTVVILLVGEFLPKTIFRLQPNMFLRVLVVPVYFFYVLFYPITKFSVSISSLLMRLTGKGVKGEDAVKSFGKVDLNNLLEEGVAGTDGEVEEHDIMMLRNALDFSEIRIRECMIPRTDLVAMPDDTTIEELIETFVESGHSRILIYNESIDNIIGYVHSSSMFEDPTSIEGILTAPVIVPETMAAPKLMDILIKERKSMAVVVDEFGVTAGIVTMEDIMEEIFGEIEDEHDRGEHMEKVMPDGTYIFSGRLEVDYLNEKYQLELTEDDAYETLAGYILYFNESIPAVGEVVVIKDREFLITKRSGARIEEVHVK
ncbi:MAG: HlyC/CorC family transporter [Marinifilaceae bacterium]|nr:HlyC/CorC family transporter [Marinifilaceae bacterium]